MDAKLWLAVFVMKGAAATDVDEFSKERMAKMAMSILIRALERRLQCIIFNDVDVWAARMEEQ